MRKFIYFIPLLVTPIFAYINVTPIEIGEEPGITGSLAFSLSTKRGNVETNEYEVDTDVRYDSNTTYALWVFGRYNYAKTHDTEIENSSFAHIRYLYMITPSLYAETFIQTEQDKFKDLSNRSLIGTDVRYRFFSSQSYGKGYIGLGALLETIKYKNPQIDPNENSMRISSYLFYTKEFDSNTRFNAYVYYQPKIDQLSDYTILSMAEMQFPIYKNFNLVVSIKANYDSKPPISSDVKKYDVTQSTTFMWKF
jgi:putative salt-induced outer membrane protein YdiY